MNRSSQLRSAHALLALVAGGVALAAGCGSSQNGDLYDRSDGSGGSSAGTSPFGGSSGSATGGSGAIGGAGGVATGGANGVGGAGTGGAGTGGAGTGGAGTGGAGAGGSGVGGTTGSGGASGALGSGGSGTGGSNGVGGTESGGTGGTGTGGTGGGNEPGSVVCGNQPCSLDQNFCCRYLDRDPECIATGDSCMEGTDVLCDGPEDCSNGQVCCGVLVDFNGGRAYNRMSCSNENDCNGNDDRIVCGDDPTACPQGRVCEQSTILPEYRFCAMN